MGSVLCLIHHGWCGLWKDGWLHGQPISSRPTYGLEPTQTDRLLLQCRILLWSQRPNAASQRHQKLCKVELRVKCPTYSMMEQQCGDLRKHNGLHQ